jgi:hypothetical protein
MGSPFGYSDILASRERQRPELPANPVADAAGSPRRRALTVLYGLLREVSFHFTRAFFDAVVRLAPIVSSLFAAFLILENMRNVKR